MEISKNYTYSNKSIAFGHKVRKINLEKLTPRGQKIVNEFIELAENFGSEGALEFIFKAKRNLLFGKKRLIFKINEKFGVLPVSGRELNLRSEVVLREGIGVDKYERLSEENLKYFLVNRYDGKNERKIKRFWDRMTQEESKMTKHKR